MGELLRKRRQRMRSWVASASHALGATAGMLDAVAPA
jgi:hypothetical protein